MYCTVLYSYVKGYKNIKPNVNVWSALICSIQRISFL